MTLKQLLSPVVWEWLEENENSPQENWLNEFNEWFEKNKELINESVKTNIDEINECIKRGKDNVRLLMEDTDDGDIDLDSLDLDNWDDEGETKKPITGKSDDDVIEPVEEEPEETIGGRVILRDPEDAKTDETNVFEAINILYNKIVERKHKDLKNSKIWASVDVSNVTDMTALFAFADMPNADLSSWKDGVSNVKSMEGMFYKSSFNNDSICDWNVSSCTNFLRMFTYSDFNQSLSKWTPGYEERIKLDKNGNPELDSDGDPIKIKTRVELPLVGKSADEKAERLEKFWGDRVDSLFVDESKENKENKNMKHILDFETFINEGFGDFVKRGVNKIKSFFRNIAVKFNNFVAMFDKEGKMIDATNPYTALNYISDGEIKGVTAFTAVKNEFLNDNVKSVASIVESPEHYGIIDENSIEYRNFQTMVSMIKEHREKNGYNKLNEEDERVGFSSTSGGLIDVEDITSEDLKDILEDAIVDVPAYKGKNAGGAILIWGAPGIGKSTIPKAIINAWNNSHETEKKSIMVVECGDLTVDGFSLPLPMVKTMEQYLKEHPEVKKRLQAEGADVESEEFLKQEFKVSGEALKTWLPFYPKSPDGAQNKIMDGIVNGHVIMGYNDKGEMETIETTEGGIILFDEFFRANESIFKILMQILLNRSFNNGQYILGSKWAIIACSNRPGDDDEVSDAFDHTGPVVGNRVSHYNFVPNFDEWKKWAVTDGYFDEATLAFLTLEQDSNGEYTNWHTVKPGEYHGGKVAWPTPRTWSKAMVIIQNIMKNRGYETVQEIPERLLKIRISGEIGKSMAEKYVSFLKTFQSKFSPKDVLNNPKYEISKDMLCSEVIDRLKKHIDVKYDKNTLPTQEQLMNMFNTLERTFNAAKDNYVRPLYIEIFNKFGFNDDKEYRDRFMKVFPNFLKAIMAKYGLKTGQDLKDFLL